MQIWPRMEPLISGKYKNQKGRVMLVKYLECNKCGKTFEASTDNEKDLNWAAVTAGIATGAAIGSAVPVVGTVVGALWGARAVANAQKGSYKCPRCGCSNKI